jgi:DNA repair protein RecO (recombination protein O)
MEWTDQGIVLSARRHGETSAIAEVLTREHGRHKGLVQGGRGRRMAGVLEAGNEVAATWRARLSEHLGSFTVELSNARAARLMDDPLRLAALSSLTATASVSLPEREPHAALYDGFRAVLDSVDMAPHASVAWAAGLVRWELGLLQELGFGLDLSACASTGLADDLIYVSPKSGRAVNRDAGEPYKERLLPLPPFLRVGETAPRPGSQTELALQDIEDGLRLTGYFLDRLVFHAMDRPAPPARERFFKKFSRFRDTSTGNHNI